MRRTLASMIQLFGELHTARQELQGDFTECLKEFYELGRRKPLTARAARSGDGAIRGIYLAMRLSGSIRQGNRTIALLKHLKGRASRGLIYKLARDYHHVEQWLEADARRANLNARAARINLSARDLRLALANKFSHAAITEDYKTVETILRLNPWLAAGDYPAVLGAAVYDRRLAQFEDQITQLAAAWKRELPDLPFEPVVRWRAGATLRISWAFVERFYDEKGLFQFRSNEIPGGISDRWLRKQPTLGSARRRKLALRRAMALRPLVSGYSDLLVWAGRWKSKVRNTLHAPTDTVTPSTGGTSDRTALTQNPQERR